MPKLMDDMETSTIQGMQKFQFSNTRIENLGATEYTLVTIAVDVTGSVLELLRSKYILEYIHIKAHLQDMTDQI